MIYILTPGFTQWVHGYSLTSVVEDQCRMLARYGHDTTVCVSSQFDKSTMPDLGPRVKLDLVMPVIEKARDYNDYSLLRRNKQHMEVADALARFLGSLVESDVLLSHDIVFTGWNLPFFQGLFQSGIRCQCYHWIHSMALHRFNWWNLPALGDNHKLVVPNRAYRQLTAEVYHTTIENVIYIPHIRDIRSFLRLGQEACDFIDDYPLALQADIVQVYPASSDRFQYKGLRDLIYLFREFKALGYSVCLIVANQWATGRQPREDLLDYQDTAVNNNLSPSEFIFTSEWRKPKYETGISQQFLRDLMSLANVFIFPTFSESFGLVLPEAILSGGVLPVINSDLEIMSELLENRGMRFGFGSWQHKLEKNHSSDWYAAVAAAISKRMYDEEAVASRSIVRQQYNMDTIYCKFYASIVRSLDGGEIDG